MMTRSIYIVVVLFFVFVDQFNWLDAQRNFQPGFVVQNNGDTLNGYIDFKAWDSNPDRIIFNAKEGDSPKVYTPLNILSYEVENRRYQSADVSYFLTDPTRSSWDTVAVPDLTKGRLFLEEVVAAPISLFSFKDFYGTQNFYIATDTGFVLLIYKKYQRIQYNDRIDKWILVENNRYKGQLAYYLQDCPNAQELIRNAGYTEGDLARVFSEYAACRHFGVVREKTRRSIKLEWFVAAGPVFSNISYTGDYFEYFMKGRNTIQPNLYPFIAFNSYLTEVPTRSSIYFELGWEYYFVKGFYQEFHSQDYYYTFRSKLGAYGPRLGMMLQFEHRFNNLTLYGGAGIGGFVPINITNTLTVERLFYGEQTFDNSVAIAETRSLELYGTGCIGLKWKRLGLEYRREIGNGLPLKINTKENRNAILLSYRLKRTI